MTETFAYVTDPISPLPYEIAPIPPQPVVNVPAVRVDMEEEYLAGGAGYFAGMGELMLPESFDDLTRIAGPGAYDIVTSHHDVARSLRTFKLSVLAGEVTFEPTYPIEPGNEADPDPDQAKSKEIADYCQRVVNGCAGWRSSLLQLLDGYERGVKLAEITCEIAIGGEDDGRLMLKTLNVKPQKAWQFIVDRAYQVTGILGRKPDGKRARYDPEKFLWLTFFPKDNDPRGTTVLRLIYAMWAFAVRQPAQWLKFLSQTAVPSLILKTAENATNKKLPDGSTVTPERYLILRGTQFQNGSVLALPHGTEHAIVEVSGEGGPFLNALKYCGNAIVSTILGVTRATEEAEHGSKADSQQGGDILDLLKQYGQQSLGEALRIGLFRKLVAFNYGEEAAERHTPYVSIGSTDASDLVARLNVLATLVSSGAITPSTEAAFYSMLAGIIPDREIDEAAAQAAFDRSQQAAGAAQTEGEGDEDDDDDEETGGGDPRRRGIPDVEKSAA
jgi:hypothetical protein